MTKNKRTKTEELTKHNWIMHRFSGCGHEIMVRCYQDDWAPEDSNWQMEALIDGYVAAKGGAPNHVEARKLCERFFAGHCVAMIAGWAREAVALFPSPEQ